MIGLLITALQLGGIILGLFGLHRISRSGRSDGFVLLCGMAFATAMASFLYIVTPFNPDLSLVPALNQFPPKVPEPWYLLRFEDFSHAYWQAGRAIAAGPDHLQVVYHRGARGGFVGFPVTAYVLLPFGLIADRQIAGIAFAFVGLLAILLSWTMMCRRYGFDRFARPASLFVLASFGPLLYSVREGNLTHLLLPAILWGIALVGTRRDLRAGLVFGVLAVFKPPLGLVSLYLLMQRRYRAVVGAAIAGAVIAGLSLAIFGWETHLVWYRSAIETYAQHPLAAFNSQSIASFIARFETGPAGYDNWNPQLLSPASSMLVTGLSLGLLAVLGWAALGDRRRGRPDAADTECELHLTILTACLISTLCWSHYFTWLLPAAAYLYSRWRQGALAAPWLAAALVSFAAIAPNEYANIFVQVEAWRPISNLVVSYRMFGALLLFAVLIVVRRQSAVPRRAAAKEVVAGA